MRTAAVPPLTRSSQGRFSHRCLSHRKGEEGKWKARNSFYLRQMELCYIALPHVPWLELSQHPRGREAGRCALATSLSCGKEGVSFLVDSQLSRLLWSQQRPGDASRAVSGGQRWCKGSVAA